MNEGFLAVCAPQDVAQYKHIFHRFMAYKHGRPIHFTPKGQLKVESYPLDHVFTNEDLQAVTPLDVCHWFCLIAYNKEAPDRNDRPLYSTRNTLLYHKKALSYFMPNTLHSWDEIHCNGNPATARDVNKVLQVIKKWDIRGEGKKSNADRPLEPEEYVYMMNALSRQRSANRLELVRYPCMFAYQVHMIGRLDDVVKLKKSWIKAHPQYDFLLSSRLPWSKNVTDKRQSPWQVVVGEDDWQLCVHLWLAKFLEIACERGTFVSSQFVFVETGDTPEKLKNRIRRNLKSNVLKTSEFKAIYEQTGRALHKDDDNANAKLGAHSNRKYAKTRPLRRGNCNEKEVDWRGRWKDMAHASSVYADTVLPFPDAKVAFELCHGGPVKYKLRDESGVGNEWIINNVSPHMSSVFGRKMAATLGKALLWACLDHEANVSVDHQLCNRIREAYATAICNNPSVEANRNKELPNPIIKVKLILYEKNGGALIEELSAANEADNNVPDGYRTLNIARQTQQHDAAVMNELAILKEELKSVKQENRDMFRQLTERHRGNDRLLKRLAHFALGHKSPTIETTMQEDAHTANTNNNISMNATLSKCPRDLWILWQEYEHGLDGRKPAKDFNDAERGQVSSTYSKRNHVWQLIRRLINQRDVHYSVAIDTIYEVYGNTSVTKIIKAIQRDARAGGHPSLR